MLNQNHNIQLQVIWLWASCLWASWYLSKSLLTLAKINLSQRWQKCEEKTKLEKDRDGRDDKSEEDKNNSVSETE